MIGPILKGEKVILKPIKVSEAENFLHWFKDSKVTRFLRVEGKDLNLKKERKIIKNIRKNKNKIVWSIYTMGGLHIGDTGLHDLDLKRNKKATWGIVIGEKSYWGQGYGTDTLKTVLKFCFTRLKLNRVELSVYPLNIAGFKCYTKCGFKEEGRKRKSIMKRGKYLDEIIMGILRKEYKN
ncbi:MAG: GNAT family protein [Patescibacteria group bacterium]|nr:GNAT family protein [Patescibacteria group bacterium]MDD5294365.1 GNAT family protein [Patescibacteria group bacterium]MDD5554191.1 GNAT family protein [Patescibacteria group bacterium]